MRTRRTRSTPRPSDSQVENQEATIVIDDDHDRSHGSKRTYLDISGGVIETCSARAAAMRRKRARNRPQKTLSSWMTLERRQNPDREKKVAEVLQGRPVLTIKLSVIPELLSGGDIAQGITLQDLQTCDTGKVLSSKVIDWLLASINSLPQLADVLIYPTYLVPFIARQRYEPVLGKQIQEWTRGQNTADESPRDLMKLGKVLIPFMSSQKKWHLAFLQPAIDRRIRLYSSSPIRQARSSTEVRHIQTFLREYQTHRGKKNSTIGARGSSWSVEVTEDLPGGDEGCNDSGAFLCAYAKALVTGQDPRLVTPEAVHELRWRMIVLGLELASATS